MTTLIVSDQFAAVLDDMIAQHRAGTPLYATEKSLVQMAWSCFKLDLYRHGVELNLANQKEALKLLQKEFDKRYAVLNERA